MGGPHTVTHRPSFLGGSVAKNLPVSAGDAGDMDSVPGSGGSPGGGNGNPLQYSCLDNSMDRGARWVHGIARSLIQLSSRRHIVPHGI